MNEFRAKFVIGKPRQNTRRLKIEKEISILLWNKSNLFAMI